MKLRPGQRDEKHRTFAGWKVRVVDGRSKFDLGTDGYWYNVADCWTDKRRAEAARDKENARPDRAQNEPKACLVPVFRREGAMREALRNLVAISTYCSRYLFHVGEACPRCDAIIAAKQLLEET